MPTKNQTQSIADALDVEPFFPEQEESGFDIVEQVENLPKPLDDEYAELARSKAIAKQQIIQLMNTANEAISELHEIARSTEKSFDYERVFKGIESVSHLAKTLVEIDKPVEKKQPQIQTVIDNSVTNNTMNMNTNDVFDAVRKALNKD